MDGVKPLSGGIPIVFPNFGSRVGFKAPGHGFARTTKWSVVRVKPSKDETKGSVAIFRMEASDVTRPMWHFEFELEYEVRLASDCIETTLTVHNTNSKAIHFQALLHNYIHTSDHLKYATNNTETRESFSITKEIDSIYKNVKANVVASINGEKHDLIVSVEKKGSVVGGGHVPVYADTDCVIWNPGKVRAKDMKDFDDEDYRYMVTTEPGRVSEYQVLAPGMVYQLNQVISVSEAATK
uniref:Glucose-6-phosphate 1-epimerase n=1 Tax=Hyaloperonospora arabidopsidis (strain Emoy2) TaxID=559515 RepID=M4BMU9_HYAAE